jgi:hypothetical protein
MWTTAASILTCSCLFLAIATLAPDRTGAAQANDAKKERAALEQKMVGEWKGRIGCDGRFLFRADGTYELTEYGPAGDADSAGTWKVRWDALPPTLVLTCKTSKIPNEVGKTTEVKLLKLDDKSLAIDAADQSLGHYTRVKK